MSEKNKQKTVIKNILGGKTQAAVKESSIKYEPTHFLRSHCKNNDASDSLTQIWGVVFEPDCENYTKTTNLVATCGGYVICIIDVTSGIVVMKYKHKDVRECFYTV